MPIRGNATGRTYAARWSEEEDKLLLEHVLYHGSSQWALLQQTQQLGPHRDSKACCNRFLLLKRKFIQDASRSGSSGGTGSIPSIMSGCGLGGSDDSLDSPDLSDSLDEASMDFPVPPMPMEEIMRCLHSSAAEMEAEGGTGEEEKEEDGENNSSGSKGGKHKSGARASGSGGDDDGDGDAAGAATPPAAAQAAAVRPATAAAGESKKALLRSLSSSSTGSPDSTSPSCPGLAPAASSTDSSPPLGCTTSGVTSTGVQKQEVHSAESSNHADNRKSLDEHNKAISWCMLVFGHAKRWREQRQKRKLQAAEGFPTAGAAGRGKRHRQSLPQQQPEQQQQHQHPQMHPQQHPQQHLQQHPQHFQQQQLLQQRQQYHRQQHQLRQLPQGAQLMHQQVTHQQVPHQQVPHQQVSIYHHHPQGPPFTVSPAHSPHPPSYPSSHLPSYSSCHPPTYSSPHAPSYNTAHIEVMHPLQPHSHPHHHPHSDPSSHPHSHPDPSSHPHSHPDPSSHPLSHHPLPCCQPVPGSQLLQHHQHQQPQHQHLRQQQQQPQQPDAYPHAHPHTQVQTAPPAPLHAAAVGFPSPSALPPSPYPRRSQLARTRRGISSAAGGIGRRSPTAGNLAPVQSSEAGYLALLQAPEPDEAYGAAGNERSGCVDAQGEGQVTMGQATEKQSLDGVQQWDYNEGQQWGYNEGQQCGYNEGQWCESNGEPCWQVQAPAEAHSPAVACTPLPSALNPSTQVVFNTSDSPPHPPPLAAAPSAPAPLVLHPLPSTRPPPLSFHSSSSPPHSPSLTAHAAACHFPPTSHGASHSSDDATSAADQIPATPLSQLKPTSRALISASLLPAAAHTPTLHEAAGVQHLFGFPSSSSRDESEGCMDGVWEEEGLEEGEEPRKDYLLDAFGTSRDSEHLQASHVDAGEGVAEKGADGTNLDRHWWDDLFPELL